MVGRDTWDGRSAALLLQADLGQPRIWRQAQGMPVVCSVVLWSHNSVWLCTKLPRCKI